MGNEIVNEINDLSQPQVIEHFVGQTNVKQQVKVALEACWTDGSRFPDSLALGGPGLGKTQISHLIALESGVVCKEVLASSISKMSELHGIFMEINDGDIIFFDEIHCLKKELMIVLYRIMENRKLFISSNNRKTPFQISLPKFSLIGATTDYHRLPKPMIDRFKLVLYFEFYSQSEIEIIIRNRCKKLNWICDDNVYSHIASKGRGTPRIALRILENTRRVARSENADIITLEHLNRSCQLEGLDNVGLNNEERRLLNILAQTNEPIRLNTLAMCLGTQSRNVAQILEPYLFRIGFITKTDKGRMLTSKGLEHIKTNPIT